MIQMGVYTFFSAFDDVFFPVYKAHGVFVHVRVCGFLRCQALRKLKSVCVRVAAGPCIIEACTIALISHFLMGLPWVWGFILG